jgi:hypothetical protein
MSDTSVMVTMQYVQVSDGYNWKYLWILKWLGVDKYKNSILREIELGCVTCVTAYCK